MRFGGSNTSSLPSRMSKKAVGHVLAEYHQAHRQGRREEKSDSSPQPGPEDGGHQDGHWRNARVLAIEPWLHHIADEEFQRRK